MLGPFKRAVMRFIRTALDVVIAICLYLIIDWITTIPAPEYIVPLITGIVAAIMKFIRSELKVNLPF